MSEFLTAMAGASLLRARAVRDALGETELASRAASAQPAVRLDLEGAGFDIIAEAKIASPSEGKLVPGDEPLGEVSRLAGELALAGAVALSILTEPTAFSGSLDHLRAVSESSRLPVLRKDFLVDPVQILEARAAGASGVLLIAKILEGSLLAEMVDQCLDLGMFPLVEVFDDGDLEKAVPVLGPEIVLGVNARDLSTLEVDPARHADLAGRLPAHIPVVAESGIQSPQDAARVAGLGYRAALVGTALVTGGRPRAAAEELIGAGRRAVSTASSP